MTKPLYFYNGSTFELVGPTTPQSPIAYQTSAPTAPATGDIWIDSDGDVDTYNRQLTRYYFVATASQTTITGVDANGLTLAYVAGSEAVYVNGALQVRGQDYTATNGTSVVMSSGLAVNDVVEIFAYTAFTVANAYTKTETDSVAAAAPGLRMVVPTSVAVGSGTGSVDTNGAVTFSGASSVSLNGCFTSAYDNYRVQLDVTGSNPGAINMRMRSGTTDVSSSTYHYSYSYSQLNSTAALTTVTSNAAQTSAWISDLSSSGTYSHSSFDLSSPFLVRPTAAIGSMLVYQNSGASLYVIYFGSTNINSTSYDGLTILPTSNTLTGTIRVYGYKD